MRTVPEWVDKIQDSEKNEQCIYDLCFNPEGTQLVVASGNRVLVYSTVNGTLLQPLKGHKETVYCVDYARNSQKFASGSSDKTVIIWSNKLEGLLKYSHGDAIQCLAFNPVSHQLVSCAMSDFAFWSAEQKAVQKFKIGARINTCSWTGDGQFLALGLGNGVISIRNKLGEERTKIERNGGATVWALAWTVAKEDQTEILCLTDWNQTLSFYSMNGKQIGKERQLGFNPLKIRFFSKGDYMLICGTNKACNLYTKDGIKLGAIGEQQNSWVWSCDVHPDGNFVVLGCQDGTIAYYQLLFNTVHGLHKERYAFRENMTDIIIQHLLTEQKVRIKCRDLIKKIAIYKHRLAVQLPERVVIYELFSSDADDMHYRVKEKITQRLDCSLLVICTEHLVICKEKTLQSMTFAGMKDKEWLFESPIRYIKVVGGPPEREQLIVGLKNGQVWEVHLDSSFPLLRVSVNDGIRCLDLNQSKEKLAVVDESGLCQVFDLMDGGLQYKEINTNSVAWNTQFDDMLAFSGNGCLAIKASDFQAHSQKLTGFVVGFSGSKVFCLNDSVISTLEIPLSAPMYQYVDKNMFQEAYKVACLGVTEGDWEELALRSLEALDLQTARMAFIKLQDYNYLELIKGLQERQQKGETNRNGLIADIYAYQGRFKEAAHLYQKAGQEHRALAMYIDLRMFDLAQNYSSTTDNAQLIRQKAEWAKNIGEYKAAADLYISVGDTQAAVDIMGEQGWTEQLIDLSKRLDKSEKEVLLSIADHLKRLNNSSAAAEIFRRLGDSESVINLHVEAKEWTQAFNLLEHHSQHKQLVYVPYAIWLAENDKFVQAQKAFHKAGRPDEAFKVLEQLLDNAATENRFDDAGYYHWILSRQCFELAKEEERSTEMLNKFQRNTKLAGIYYAYNNLHKYLEEPFTSLMPEALFNISRFVMSETAQERPKGVSLFTILYCFSKQARLLGANKLAKQLLDRIHTLRVPLRFQEQVEIAAVAARARPYSDPDELVPMCYRCSTYNPLAVSSDKCVNCGQKFVYSFVSFEILPLVEFYLEDGISDAEAIRLLETSEEPTRASEEITETHQTLRLEEDVEESDPFTAKLMTFESGDANYNPVVVGRKALLKMDDSSVLVCKWGPPLKYRYYRNLLPDVPVTMCNSCFNVFHTDDFELQVLQRGFCPFCRVPPLEVPTVLDSGDSIME